VKFTRPILTAITIFLPTFYFSCSSPDQEMEKKPTQYTIEQFMNVERVFGSSFSPDESKILINSKSSGIYNVYEIDVATGTKTQLTSSTSSAIYGRSYFPEDERIIYTSDQEGNEISHVYLREENGEATDITPDSIAKSNFGGWNHAKTKFYISSNKRDPKFFDLYKTTIDSKNGGEAQVFPSEMIYQNNDGMNVSSISTNERYFALSKPITTNRTEMYLLDSESGKTINLSLNDSLADYSPQYFDLNDTKLYYLTNEGNEFKYLKSYNLESGEHKTELKEDWDIWYVYLSQNGKYKVVGINDDAKTVIKVFNEADGTLVELPEMPAGEISSVNISDSENLMSFYVSSSKSSSNLFVYNFKTKKLDQLTDTMNPEINQDHLVDGKVIRFKSFDGMEIPAILYTPKGLAEGEKIPAMLMIHGGPGGQTRLNYTDRIQYFVNHGYAILAVNNRGSSGYGKTFYAADDLKHGDEDLRDCIESKKYLESLGYIDMDKVGIMGGSYGGYMVMAALAFAPEEFALGVNYFGVTNWLRTLKSIPPWWESFKNALYQELGNPYTDSLTLYNKSPLFFANQITKPFIVLQGSNDPRVLKVESDEIVEKARANGVEVEYVLFDDEGHGFSKKENNITASKKVLAFLDKHFKENKSTSNKKE
jgi:dipeptidyl aminopeptidase/acylaminoacyl peptidase